MSVTARTLTVTESANSARRPSSLSWVAATENRVLGILRVIGVPALRIGLGLVYIWFGVLKLLGTSPVADLVASMLPFLPADLALTLLGLFEVTAGGLLLLGVLVPWIAAAMVLHLFGTFAVFVIHPSTALSDPITWTLEGEFIAKNVVLVAGLLVVGAFTHARPRTKTPPAAGPAMPADIADEIPAPENTRSS